MTVTITTRPDPVKRARLLALIERLTAKEKAA